ncbi:MAG: isoleucine--tRNA ligase [Planctomycetia bacterium]|nr:isoleucine--tRNA ligase [Planctomycetia bacterium]
MFEPVRGKPDFPALEASIAEFWRTGDIYRKSLERRRDGRRFVFFEGPPTANGMPHPGHCLTRTIKDLYPRYRTMRGDSCERKAGWDTHGLPVEVEVCKELGIHSKAEIEAYGVEPFIHRCQESVWRYMKEWETLTERIGFWIDLSSAYVTYHRSFVESVWWALAELFDRGLLYEGHKIVWWWAQGGTALSSGEVGQGYREVADPSVYVAFPLVDDTGRPSGQSLVAWTTTPWTLPSNQFAAVRADLDYVALREAGAAGDGAPGSRGGDAADRPASASDLIVAEPLAAALGEKLKKTFDVVGRCTGADLVGRSYLPPFDTFRPAGPPVAAPLAGGGSAPVAWRVVAADFVTTDSGTGVVHVAPAFGEVDYGVLVAEQARFTAGAGPDLINCVAPDGTFTDAFPMGSGRFVKDCDRDITRDLRGRGLLVHQEQYVHDYPFCWRADADPLIQYPRQSWFIRTSQFRDQMLANNARINWLPDHIKEGRFGNFLETNVDWALSRERYWGTPLPIWKCETTGRAEAVPSYAALLAKPGVQGTDVFDRAKAANPGLSEDLRVHKPYIDAVTYDSPFAPAARMRRVPEVIDCWFDSGAMPFAQWGWPHAGHEEFGRQFPADFISEAIDQTRGWFYSQLAISTLLFGEAPTPYPHPFRTCIVLGHMLGEDGQKMSKSRRNYREPAEILDTYGADALRWFFLAGQPPWTSIRYSERAIRESIPEFLLRLWNVYSFFVIYARIDGFDPATLLPRGVGRTLDHADLRSARGWRPVAERAELDRWMLSELNATAGEMVQRLDAYDHYGAAARLSALVDAVSNWFVRRSRDRFWAPGRADGGPDGNPAKLDAYWTLYETLLSIARMAAPFVPFVSEAIWRNLAVAAVGDAVAESVHLTDYPCGDESLIDRDLVRRMALVRDVASLGRAARAAEKLKVRQPLSKVEVILADDDAADAAWLEAHADLVCDELNVRQFEICREPDRYITRSLLPDLKRLGPRLGKDLPRVRDAITKGDAAALLAGLARDGRVSVALAGGGEAVIERDDVMVRTTAREGWAAAEGPRAVVVVASQLTPDLVAEGLVREVVHAVQSQRKALDLDFTDRIELAFETTSPELRGALETHLDYVSAETLATMASFGPLANARHESIDVDGHPLSIAIRPAGTAGGAA